MTDTPAPIRNRDRDTIIQALAAGVVPRNGLRHIQVGRASEVGALIRDIDRISDEGAAIRFIIGEYGTGKTFFLNLVRLIALESSLLSMLTWRRIAVFLAGTAKRADFTPNQCATWRRGPSPTAVRSPACWSGS